MQKRPTNSKTRWANAGTQAGVQPTDGTNGVTHPNFRATNRILVLHENGARSRPENHRNECDTIRRQDNSRTLWKSRLAWGSTNRVPSSLSAPPIMPKVERWSPANDERFAIVCLLFGSATLVVLLRETLAPLGGLNHRKRCLSGTKQKEISQRQSVGVVATSLSSFCD